MRHSGALWWAVVLALIVLTVVRLFGWGVSGVVDAWGEPEYSHGWLIPVITLFCLWQRRQQILSPARLARGAASR